MASIPLPLIPIPRQGRRTNGYFVLTPDTRIIVNTDDAVTLSVAGYLQKKFRPAMGCDLRVEHDAPDGPGIVLRRDDLAGGAPESYSLSIRPDGVEIVAPDAAGIFYGIQSMIQLAEPAIGSESVQPKREWPLPACDIADEPVFNWRGLLLDCSRHFISVSYVKKIIDILADLKLNVLHLHLTDDTGWRIEIPAFPELVRTGAFLSDDRSVCGYYSRDNIREIVKYAAERFVSVVPEVDLPGHSFSAMRSYPELCCTGKPVRNPGHAKDLYCAGDDHVIQFLETVLGEVADMFPAPYIHIGGDEAPKDRWRECPKCQARIRAENLSGEEGLQAWLTDRMTRFLETLGKRAIGWDEIVDGQSPSKSAVVQWWRYRSHGDALARQAVERGYDVIASPNSFCYLSFPVRPNEHFKAERTSILEQVYSARYIPDGISDAERRHVLGAECAVWTEYLTESDIDAFLFPRLLAAAELMWSYPDSRDFVGFQKRVRHAYPRLDARGIAYGPEA